MIKKIQILPFFIFLLIIFLFLFLLITDRDPSQIPSVLIEKKVPNFKAKTLLSNKTFSSENNFYNEITLVNFFATWCGPCRDEHPYILELSNIKDIKIIGINYKDNADSTIKWFEEMGNPYTEVLKDKNGEIGIEWGIYGIPETFIINKKGIIKYRHPGPITKKGYNNLISIINNL